MGLPAGFPATTASLDSVGFWELNSDGRAYAPYPTEGDRIIVGQTVIRRFRQPRTVTILGLAGTSDATSLEGKEGGTYTLVWHRGSTSNVYVDKVITKRIPQFGIAEVEISVII
jgi:hypothetical protein